MPPIDFTRRTALYRLYDADSVLLYVGIAFDPELRWNYHNGSAAWWPLVARKNVDWHETRLLALAAEEQAIEDEKPLYNVLGSQFPSQVPRSINLGIAPNRFFRMDDETWAEYGLACEALGISRSDDLRMRAKERIAEYRRNQRREAAAAVKAADA